MRRTGTDRGGWDDVALRAFRSPLSGLAALLASDAAEHGAPLAAIHLIPSDDKQVELLTSGGSDAGILGPPGRVPAGAEAIIRRASADAAIGGATSMMREMKPWSQYPHVVSTSIPLESSDVCLITFAHESRPERGAPAIHGGFGLLVQMLLQKREIERLRKDLYRIREDQGLRAAGLQHDLKGPLTSILGASRTLSTRAGELEPRVTKDLLDGIGAQALRMARMLETTLTSDTHIPVRRMRVDLRDAVERAVATATDIRSGRIEIESAGEVLVTDPDRLERALLNLLDNALKYTPKGIPVHVLVEEENDHVSVTVADNGPGVSADVLPGLFTAYATDPDRTDGTGLGLHSAHSLIEELGGRIRYTRASGWTRFTLTLPRGEA